MSQQILGLHRANRLHQNHLLHQPPLTPLRGLHQPQLTPSHALHAPPLTPSHGLHQPPFTPNRLELIFQYRPPPLRPYPNHRINELLLGCKPLSRPCSNKKLVVTSATLVVTGALLVVTTKKSKRRTSFLLLVVRHLLLLAWHLLPSRPRSKFCCGELNWVALLVFGDTVSTVGCLRTRLVVPPLCVFQLSYLSCLPLLKFL